MNKYARLGKNTITVFIGNAGAKLIGLLMLPFYTRWLSVEGYGTTDIINVYVNLLLGLATACIADAVFIFPKGQPIEQQKTYFSSGLCFTFLSLGVTAFLFKAASVIFVYKEISNSFTDNAWFVYGLLVTSFLQQYIQQFVRSIDKMKVYSTTGIVLTVSTAVFSFFIIPKWGVSGYVFALILANILAAVYSAVFSGAFKYLAIKAVKKSACAEMLKYSVPLIPNGIMWWLVGAFNRPLIEKYVGMHEVGIFAVANKFSGIILVMFSMFAVSWQVSVLEEFHKEKYGHFYNTVFHLLASGMFVLFFVITIFSKIIIGLFVDSNFYDAWKYIGILTLGAMLQGIASFTASNFSAIRESKYFFYSAIWTTISSIIFNLILIPKFGIIGAAISMPLSLSVLAVSRLFYAQKYVKIHNIMRYLLLLLIACMTIIVMLYVQIVLLKYILLAFLFLLFLILNYELKTYVSKILTRVALLLLHTFKEKNDGKSQANK